MKLKSPFCGEIDQSVYLPHYIMFMELLWKHLNHVAAIDISAPKLLAKYSEFDQLNANRSS